MELAPVKDQMQPMACARGFAAMSCTCVVRVCSLRQGRVNGLAVSMGSTLGRDCRLPIADCRPSQPTLRPLRGRERPESMRQSKGTEWPALGKFQSDVAETTPPSSWTSLATVAPVSGNRSRTSAARVACVRFSPSQAAGQRRIAYVRHPRCSLLPIHQRAFRSLGGRAVRSMGGARGSGDKFAVLCFGYGERGAIP